jgi:hypothetical protein
MTAKNIIIFLLCAGTLFGACHKSGGSSSGPTVYTAGEWGNTTYNVAAYWVNNRLVSLTDTMHVAFARSIFVSGNDVYVAGVVGPIGNGVSNVPVYWKNGQENPLSVANFATFASSIYVSNGNVYVSGEDYGYAVYWVNGKETRLSGAYFSSEAVSIAVDGSDVYVLGVDSLKNPCFWKNGQPTELKGVYITAVCLAVSGGDVYVAGQQFDTLTNNRRAILWKNGVADSLSDGSADVLVSSLTIDGSDIYVCGNTAGPTGYVSTVWKNGQLLPMQGGSSGPLYAWGVGVVNGAVYVGGNESAPGQIIAAYWSAGGVTELDKNLKHSSTVWGIFVR